MQLKVCGMREPDNIRQLALLSPQYMGLIFYKPSPRFAGNSQNLEIIRSLPAHIRKVGVFVDQEIAQVARTIETYDLQVVQLHGQESPAYCRVLAERLKVIKTFSIDEAFDFAACREYAHSCDMFLFDTKGKYYGGNGQKFDWKLLQQYQLSIPFLLSGGLGIQDAEELKALHHPAMIGVDVNSGFEVEKGVKDIQAIKEFKRALI